MTDQTPQSANEALLADILGGTYETRIPASRMEKIWAYALGGTVELEAPQSRIEVLAIQVAEQVRNGGETPTGTITITANGVGIDVAQYAEADVAVPIDTTNEDSLVTRTLTTYTNDRVESAGNYAFNSLPTLTSVSLPNATSLGESTFSYCTNLASISIPKVSDLTGTACFRNVGSNLTAEQLEGTKLELPALTTLPARNNTFKGFALETLSLPNLINIANASTQFFDGHKIKHISAPKATSIHQMSASSTGVSTLLSVDTRSLITLPNSYVAKQANLTSVAPMRSLSGAMGSAAFQSCSSLTSLELGGTVTSIAANTFNGCTALEYIVFDFASVPTVYNASAFTGCTAIFYVPDALVDSWKAASGWSSFAAQIKPLSEKPSS